MPAALAHAASVNNRSPTLSLKSASTFRGRNPSCLWSVEPLAQLTQDDAERPRRNLAPVPVQDFYEA